MQPLVDEEAVGDLSFSGWCERQAGRRDVVGNYCRWISAGSRPIGLEGERPRGYPEARAEYEIWWTEQVKRPAIQKHLERIRVATDRPTSAVLEPTVELSLEAVLVGALSELSEVVAEVLEQVPMMVGRRERLHRNLRRVDGQVTLLRRMAHAFTTNTG